MSDENRTLCPRCGEGRLRGWNELSEEDRMIVRRMPESLDYSPGERESLHRWCANCWYEETESAPCEG